MAKQGSKIGFIGIGFGFGSVALLLALVHFWAGSFSPQPTVEQTVAEKAVAIKKATLAALKGEKTEIKNKEAPWDTDRVLYIITALLGGLPHCPNNFLYDSLI
ncbi:MAG: hypothetical protein KZQ83_04315 [gamma proteobacterium symbiont of Taylorina sp.]|nr:hypothetical protein [gamma proteobacterium symbiont of Taylorina sp.]